MKINAKGDAAVEAENDDFKPMTAQEADQWRRRNPSLSMGKIVAGQAMVGAFVAALTWLVTGRPYVGWSAAYGALSVVIPAALFARGMARQRVRGHKNSAMAGFLGWEIAKILLTVALLVAAPRLVPQLSWLALLAGMVLTMKTYWVALWARPGVPKTD